MVECGGMKAIEPVDAGWLAGMLDTIFIGY